MLVESRKCSAICATDVDAAMRDSFMAADTRKLYTVAETEEEVFRQLEEYKSFSYNKYRRWYGGSV